MVQQSLKTFKKGQKQFENDKKTQTIKKINKKRSVQ